MVNSSILLADKPCWLDLPKDHLENLGNFQCNEISEINNLVHEYHLIPKTDTSKIISRIEILKNIEKEIIIQCNKEVSRSSKKFLKNIYLASKEKRIYLEELELLRLKFVADPDYINHYFYTIPEGFDKGIPLFLFNRKMYDSTLRIYWGENFVEILDPCHRFLTTYFDLWREMNSGNQDYFSFFVWLEGQNLPFEMTSVHFFSEKEKSEKEIICINGKLCLQKTAEVFSCSKKDKEYLFVIDLDERLFLCEGSKEIRHDSLTFGKPVLSAGAMIIEKGDIVRLALESGHYQPSVSNGVQLLNILRKKGINISPEVLFDFYYNFEKCTLSIKDFDDKYGACNIPASGS